MSSNDYCPLGNSSDYCRRQVPLGMVSSSKKPGNFLQICGNKICDNINIPGSGSMSQDMLLLNTMKQQLQDCQSSGNKGGNEVKWQQKYKQLKQEVESQALKFQGTIQRVDLESMSASKRMTFAKSPIMVNGQLKK